MLRAPWAPNMFPKNCCGRSGCPMKGMHEKRLLIARWKNNLASGEHNRISARGAPTMALHYQTHITSGYWSRCNNCSKDEREISVARVFVLSSLSSGCVRFLRLSAQPGAENICAFLRVTAPLITMLAAIIKVSDDYWIKLLEIYCLICERETF